MIATTALAATVLAVTLAAPGTVPAAASRTLFHLTDPRITESSGIAVATRESGVWFTHNDSGDSPRFFAVGSHGQTPRVTVSRRAVTAHVKAVRYQFRYPDGPRNAESLLVDPRTSRIYIASKSLTGDTHVYVAPAHPSTTRVNDLSELGDLQWVPRPGAGLLDLAEQVATTGGAFSADGRSFVLRTYTDAYLFRLRGSGPLAVAAAVAGDPLRIVLPRQPQGEGVCFRRDGKALVISSEHARSAVDEVLLPKAVPVAGRTADGG